MKSISIMQPYFLLYIGYFQLIAAVDKFVVYDDVNFMKGGWINRNRILLNGTSYTFTLPLQRASPNKLICEIERDDNQRWHESILRTIHHAYNRAPNYPKVAVLLENVINFPAILLSEFLVNSLREIAHYLSLEVEIVHTSRHYTNAELNPQPRPRQNRSHHHPTDHRYHASSLPRTTLRCRYHSADCRHLQPQGHLRRGACLQLIVAIFQSLAKQQSRCCVSPFIRQ